MESDKRVKCLYLFDKSRLGLRYSHTSRGIDFQLDLRKMGVYDRIHLKMKENFNCGTLYFMNKHKIILPLKIDFYNDYSKTGGEMARQYFQRIIWCYWPIIEEWVNVIYPRVFGNKSFPSSINQEYSTVPYTFQRFIREVYRTMYYCKFSEIEKMHWGVIFDTIHPGIRCMYGHPLDYICDIFTLHIEKICNKEYFLSMDSIKKRSLFIFYYRCWKESNEVILDYNQTQVYNCIDLVRIILDYLA